MLERIRGWFGTREAEQEAREAEELETVARAADEERRAGPDQHDIAEDRLQHPAQHAPPW